MKAVLKGFIVTLMLSLVLLGCANSSRLDIDPVETTQESYDLKQAAELITYMEQPVETLLSRTTISRSELQVLRQQAVERYFSDGHDVTGVFFDIADMDNEQLSELPVLPNMFYPILKHENIEITEAYVDKKIYVEEHSALNKETLFIKEAYTGEDEYLKEHYRTYIFEKDPQGGWRFKAFSGTLNYSGESFTPTYLPYK